MTHHGLTHDPTGGFAAAAADCGFAPRVLTTLAAGPLTVWEKPGPGKLIYISAAIHGDEPAGPLALTESLRAGTFAAPHHWLLCPVINPDGLAAATRCNADGLDLNRDFLTRRSHEIAALTAWLGTLPPPDLFLSLHEDWETTGFYLYEINLGPDQPQRAAAIIDAVRPWFAPEPGPLIDDHHPRAPGWIYHDPEPDEPTGWPEAIHLAKHGCPLSFTFETPSRAPLAHRVAAHTAALAAALGADIHSWT